MEWLAIWGVSAAWSVFRPILEDLAKDVAKDIAKSYVGHPLFDAVVNNAVGILRGTRGAASRF
jgi:hypothetical protein